MQPRRPPLTIYPPEREGDRESLIAALAAALVAIARQRAAYSDEPSRHPAEMHGPTVRTA